MESVTQLIRALGLWLEGLNSGLAEAMARLEQAGAVYTLFARWVFPLLAALIFIRCALPLLQKGKKSGYGGFSSWKTGPGIR